MSSACTRRCAGDPGAARPWPRQRDVPAPARDPAGAARLPAAAKEAEGGGGIDQQTLLLGISGMLALLVICGVLLWLVLRDRVGGHDASKTSAAPESRAEIEAKEKQLLAGSTKPGSPNPAAPSKTAASVERELPRDELNELNTLIGEIRKDRGENPQAALDQLINREKDLDRRGYKKPANLLAAIGEMREAVAQHGGAAPAEPKTEATPPAPQEPKAEEKKATPEATKEEPAEKKEEPATPSEPDELEKE